MTQTITRANKLKDIDDMERRLAAMERAFVTVNSGVLLPYYGLGELPTLAEPNEMCFFDLDVSGLDDGSASFRCLASFHEGIGGGAWEVIGGPSRIQRTGSPLNGTLTTGWRKGSSGAYSVKVPYHGSYYAEATADMAYSAAEPVGGVGVASMAVAAATSPAIIATGHAAAGERANLKTDARRVITTPGDDTTLEWDLRFNTNNSVSFSTARTTLTMWPAYLYGEA